MFIGCFSAAKVLLFSEICKFLGEKYAKIGRFRQEWARIALTEAAHRATKADIRCRGKEEKNADWQSAQYKESNGGKNATERNKRNPRNTAGNRTKLITKLAG